MALGIQLRRAWLVSWAVATKNGRMRGVLIGSRFMNRVAGGFREQVPGWAGKFFEFGLFVDESVTGAY
jgi:hypothetical protein